WRATSITAIGAVTTRLWERPRGLLLQLDSIRNHLPGQNIHIERHRAIARRTNLDVVTTWCQSQGLRRRRELISVAHRYPIHNYLGRRRRDLEADTPHVAARRSRLDADRRRWRIHRGIY